MVNSNPYAPPSSISDAEVPSPSMATLNDVGPIPFSGSVSQEDVRGFLRTDSHVGCVYLLSLGAIFGLVAMVLIAQGGGLAAIAIGIMGLYLISSIVSTEHYRWLMFNSANPDYRRPSRGELQPAGIQLTRDDVETFFRWEWYWNAVVGESWVAFLPATQPANPLLLSRGMVDRIDDWDRVLQVAQSITANSTAFGEGQRRQQILHLMRQDGRRRRMQVPAGAIRFQGIVRSSDLSSGSNRELFRHKPVRSYAVLLGLLVCGAFVVAGLSHLLFQQFAFLPVMLATYIALAAAGIAVRTKRRPSVGPGVVSFLNAYADEDSVATDYGIVTSTCTWSCLKLIRRRDDLIILRHHARERWIVARRDMFASQDDWHRFNDLVEQNGLVESTSDQNAMEF